MTIGLGDLVPQTVLGRSLAQFLGLDACRLAGAPVANSHLPPACGQAPARSKWLYLLGNAGVSDLPSFVTHLGGQPQAELSISSEVCRGWLNLAYSFLGLGFISVLLQRLGL